MLHAPVGKAFGAEAARLHAHQRDEAERQPRKDAAAVVPRCGRRVIHRSPHPSACAVSTDGEQRNTLQRITLVRTHWRGHGVLKELEVCRHVAAHNERVSIACRIRGCASAAQQVHNEYKALRRWCCSVRHAHARVRAQQRLTAPAICIRAEPCLDTAVRATLMRLPCCSALPTSLACCIRRGARYLLRSIDTRQSCAHITPVAAPSSCAVRTGTRMLGTRRSRRLKPPMRSMAGA